MKTIKTKEPKLAPKPEKAIMRENAARIASGRANIAEQKKVEKKAKIKGAIKKAAPFVAMGAMGALTGIGVKMNQAYLKKHGK